MYRHGATADSTTVGASDEGIERRTAAGRQEAARHAYRQSIATGRPLTGVALGRMFGLSARWGSERTAEVRTELAAALPANSRQGVPRRPPPADRQQARGRPQGIKQPPPSGNNGNRVSNARGNGVPNGSNGNGAYREQVPTGHGVGTAARPTTDVASTATPAAAAGAGTRSATSQARARGRQRLGWQDRLIIGVVAVVTALASYGHMYEVALLAGEPLWIARAWPITVDGLVLVALRRGDQGRAWLALGLAVSVAANVLAKYPEVVETVAPLISAFPPVALYGIHRLVHAHAPEEETT